MLSDHNKSMLQINNKDSWKTSKYRLINMLLNHTGIKE